MPVKADDQPWSASARLLEACACAAALAFARTLVPILALTSAQAAASGAGEPALATMTVTAQRVANLQPASSYAAPVTALRFDPRVDLQPRGLPEGQADVTVRGGLFEGTGFNVGAVALFDPQTGHYFAEVPLDTGMLSAPEILTGIDNALAGFNATVATVQYEIAPVRAGGDLALGAGTDDLRFMRLRAAATFDLTAGNDLAAAVAYASSRSDGSRPDGDHAFDRFSAQLQHRGDGHQSNLLYGYQDKFFGWPGAYTGFATLPETDHTRTHLVLASHRRALGADGWWEVAGSYRELDDDYDFDRRTRESGVPGAFDHKTRNHGLSLRGLVPGAVVDWRFAVHAVADELVSSTDLTEGNFSERSYGKLSLVPEKTWPLDGGRALKLRGGLSADLSSRDSNALLPMAGLVLSQVTGHVIDTLTLEYVATSQVPGYTALKSRPAGLFGGNADLGREHAKTLVLKLARDGGSWFGAATLFYREDRDLVDWTFRSGAPFARQANPVDIDVTGVEVEVAKRWSDLEIIGGYTYLHKDEDYGAAQVDASFYALNYARQRLTVAISYQPFEWLDVRLDNAYRQQRGNPLRTTGADAYQASLSLGWRTPVAGMQVNLVVDNLTDNDFQAFPGTPAPRRQTSLNAAYAW